MNDATLSDLRAHVEGALATVPAGRGRRRQMREELLAHLLAIYDEEFAHLGDAGQAADAAKRRFGDPRELTSELADAVAWRERVFFLFTAKEHIMWRWLLALGVVAVLVGMAFVCPALAYLTNQELTPPGTGYPVAQIALLLLGVTVTLGGLVSGVYGVMQKVRPRAG